MTEKSALDRAVSLELVMQQAIDKTWFTYAGQRQKIYQLAKELRVADADLKDEECIDMAEAFVSTYYTKKIDPNTRS